MQKHVNLVDLVKSFPTNIHLSFAKFGFATAENEPGKVCPLSVYRSPRYPFHHVIQREKERRRDGVRDVSVVRSRFLKEKAFSQVRLIRPSRSLQGGPAGPRLGDEDEDFNRPPPAFQDLGDLLGYHSFRISECANSEISSSSE